MHISTQLSDTVSLIPHQGHTLLLLVLSLRQKHFIYAVSHYAIFYRNTNHLVRFEVFTAVTMKNSIFLDVMQCGSCKNRRFGGL
jgi:hypothetical protein